MAVLKFGSAQYSSTYFGGSGATPRENFAGITPYSLYNFTTQMVTSGVFRGLFLYKGVQATQAELDAVPTSTLISAWTGILRYSDVLAYMPVGSCAWSGYNLVSKLLPVKAINSGLATWFAFGYYYSSTGNSVGTALVCGSVGAVGSGADLELETTNYTSGILYKLNNFSLAFPNGYAV